MSALTIKPSGLTVSLYACVCSYHETTAPGVRPAEALIRLILFVTIETGSKGIISILVCLAITVMYLDALCRLLPSFERPQGI